MLYVCNNCKIKLNLPEVEVRLRFYEVIGLELRSQVRYAHKTRAVTLQR